MNRKLRGFVIDQSTGAPLARVPLGILGVVLEGAPPVTNERVLGIVQSDHAGFFSVPIGVSMRLESVVVYPLADPSHRVELPDFLKTPEAGSASPIPLPAKTSSGTKLSRGYPSIIEPDTIDWIISPKSFATTEPLRIGTEGCEELVISHAVSRTFRFSQIVREPSASPNVLRPAGRTGGSGGPSVNVATSIQPICETPLQESLCWRRGALLLYETTWAPIGHALGEIAYSLALAPCEQVSLAVIEWSRHDSLVRGEDTSQAEQLQHNLRRDRSIEETVDGVLSESQSGSSVSGGLGGTIGIATLGIAGSYAGTGGMRKVASDAVQEISDRIVQASTLAQRFNSTVIVQASQAERDAVQTRTVANHNHCHALTVLYYQVLRHFLVETRLADKQDVILVTRPVYKFEMHSEVLRYRTVLQRVLLDASLLRCFGALEEEFCAQVRLDKRGFVEEPRDHELQDIKARIRTGANGLGDAHAGLYSLSIKLLVKSGAPVPLTVLDGLYWLDWSSPPVWAPLPIGWIAGQRNPQISESKVLASEQEDIFTLRPARRINWGEVTHIEVSYEMGSQASSRKYDLLSLRLETSTGGDHWVVYDDATPINVTLTSDVPPVQDTAKITREVGQFGPQKPEDVLSDPELCCVEKLMQHLRDNALYYSRAIWLAEDRDVRAEWLNLYSYELDGQSGRLLDFVRNEIVGVVGDYIALPLASQDFADTLEVPKPEQRIVSVPTRGLFAEAKLGSCDACEEIDVTRFWDWTESPCPERPPTIEGVHPGSRAQAMEAAPTVTTPTLGIQTPPAEPEPAGIAAVLDALSKSDIFRDMSNKEGTAGIVESLVKGAIDLEKAKIMQKPSAGAPSGAPTPSGGGASEAPVSGAAGKPPSEGREMHDKLKAIEGAEKRGDISPETAQTASENVVLASAGGGAAPASQEYVIPWDWKLTYADNLTGSWWGGAVAAMLSWRDAQSLEGKPYTIQQAMQLLDSTRPNDPIFESKCKNTSPLLVLPATGSQPAIDELAELLKATKTGPNVRMLRRSDETFNAKSGSFTLPHPEQIRKLLMQYGPLCLADIGADVMQGGENVNGFLGGGLILSALMGDGTEEGSKVQIFTVRTKEVGVISFEKFLSIEATESVATARDGEVFFLHFE